MTAHTVDATFPAMFISSLEYSFHIPAMNLLKSSSGFPKNSTSVGLSSKMLLSHSLMVLM